MGRCGAVSGSGGGGARKRVFFFFLTDYYDSFLVTEGKWQQEGLFFAEPELGKQLSAAVCGNRT